jgi:exodeoxyribonuclease VII large subunit
MSVRAYSAQIGAALRQVGGALVEGEVQRPRSAGRSFFFDLTDGEAKLACKVFGQDLRSLEHVPHEGDLVQVVIDRPDFWIAAGKLDVIVSQVKLAGEGELLRRRQELLARLEAEGLTDPARRKPLPAFPRAVGVIAGRDSDGLSDVVRALVDRFPPVHAVVCAALVQGASAPREIIDALARLQDHPDVNVVVIARGGGSVQDLVAFDDEGLCRAIFASSQPVITAIGHTDNVPVCNHVAWPAFTPSRSAELAVPSARELRQRMSLAAHQVDAVGRRVDLASERVSSLGRDLRPSHHVARWAGDVMANGRAIDSASRSELARIGGVMGANCVALNAVPRHLRAFAVPNALRRAIDDRAASFYEERRQTIERYANSLQLPTTVTIRAAVVRESWQRIAAGMRRQAADHDHDYRRAFDRLTRQARVGFDRRARRAGADVHSGSTVIVATTRRRLIAQAALHEERTLRLAVAAATADRRVERLAVSVISCGRPGAERGRRNIDNARELVRLRAATVAAQDPRRRGWVLAADLDGAALRSVDDLQPGLPAQLTFVDGRASATIGTIEAKEGA